MRVHLTIKSRNVKTGPMPVSTTTAESCPPSCAMFAACYAKGGPLAIHWRNVTNGLAGMAWNSFCEAIASLPMGTLWRHNQAGDLPGIGDTIDSAALSELVVANSGRRGFTYTHKPTSPENLVFIRAANEAGFTINLSANTLEEADSYSDTGLPVVVVLDVAEGERHDVLTPQGRKVATCPATYLDDVSCQSCGLCAVQNRKVIVGFPAHGTYKRKAATVARAA